MGMNCIRCMESKYKYNMKYIGFILLLTSSLPPQQKEETNT